MLYDRYAEKIKRYARIRDNILRFKIPIICTFAAVIVAWSGFLITKGMITEQVNGDTEYVYGDIVSFKAKALFSKVTYEYSSGGEWSEDAPVMPGEYQVRAVAEQSFGRTNYSDPFSFVIRQKEMTVLLSKSTVEWKESPELGSSGLVRGDKLGGADVTLSHEELGEAMADIDENSVVILSLDGEDVTAAYIIIAEDGNITVEPRTVTVAVDNITKEYDGTPIRTGGYTVASGSILEGHALALKLSVEEFTDVGSHGVDVLSHNVSEGDRDISEYYRMSFISGNASITPRRITVSSEDVTKIYDGTPLELPDYYFSKSAAEGEIITVKEYEDDIIVPMTVTHITGYAVNNTETGEDMSRNYDITVDSGTLTVTRRPVTVITQNISKEYDGTPLMATGVDAYSIGGEGLVYENDLTVLSFASLISAGSTENAVRYRIDGSLYDVTESFGTLTVEKRGITLKTGSAEEYYSGAFLENNATPEVVSGSLVKDHEIGVQSWKSIDSVKRDSSGNVIGIDNTLTIGIHSDSDGDVILNYEITWEYGTLKLLPMEINVTLNDKVAVYDGQNVELDAKDYTLDRDILSGHKLSLTTDCINAGEYKFTPQLTVKSGSKDVTGNYEFTVDGTLDGYLNGEYSVLTVKKRVLEYSTDDETWEYNGKEHFRAYPNIRYSADSGLADGHFYEVYDRATVTNVLYDSDGNVIGTENYIKMRIYDRDGKYVTDNYDIVLLSNGTLTVTPKAIHVISGGDAWTYDGSEHGTTDVTCYDLIDGHSIELISYTVVRNVRRSPDGGLMSWSNEISFKIVDQQGNDVGGNYCYGDKGYGGYLSYGWLTILPRPVTIASDSGSKIYDRTALTNGNSRIVNSDDYEEEGLLVGHTLNKSAYSVVGSIIGVGSAKNTIKYADKLKDFIYDAYGNDVTSNYDIIFDEGTLTVKPIPITVTPDYVGAVYDAKSHSSNSYTSSGKVLDGDIGLVYVRLEGSGVDAGTYDSNVSVAVVIDEFGVGVWDNGAMRHYTFIDTSLPMYIQLSDGTYLRIFHDGTVNETAKAGTLNYSRTHTDLDGDSSNQCNYTINAQTGVINIRKRKITITGESKTETYYKGKVLTSSGCRISEGEAADGHTIYAAAYGKATQKGVAVDNKVDVSTVIIFNSAGDDITEQVIGNYDIKTVAGQLLMV